MKLMLELAQCGELLLKRANSIYKIFFSGKGARNWNFQLFIPN